MRTIRIGMLLMCAVAVILVMSLHPAGLYAQSQARGQFSFSQNVRWGGTVLPAGDYTYSVESAVGRAFVRIFQRGGSFSGLFWPLTSSRTGYSGPDHIVLTRIGAEMFVSSLKLGTLGSELSFYNSSAAPERPSQAAAALTDRPTASVSTAEVPFTVFDPKHENVSVSRMERVYLAACEAVDREIQRTTPFRPRLAVHLGAEYNRLRFPDSSYGEIYLKKWDDYRFAEAVIALALHKLVSVDEQKKLSDLAASQAAAVVNLCELKGCSQ